jgi:hypothetical protein
MNWKKTHFYLHTFCRYFLATMILSYAFAKILGTQFITQPSAYDKPVAFLSGFELTWYYYGYSYWYGLFISGSQIVSALLLFFRKTTRLGIVLFLSFMVNILLVDFAYDIHGAKGFATIMTIMALFVFFSEFPLFIKYFLTEPPLFQDKDRPTWVNKFTKVKWVYIPLVFLGFFLLISTLKNKYMGQNQFYGSWQNMDKSAQFNRLHFEALQSFSINERCNNTKIADGQYTFTKDTVVLKVFTNSDTTKSTILIKGKYQIDRTNLSIQTDSGKMMFKKIARPGRVN